MKKANFLPDGAIPYLEPTQLRGLLLSFKIEDVPEVSGRYFPLSCGYAVVEAMQTGKYWAGMPDPGEYQMALTEEGDRMFCIPQSKLPGMMAGLRQGGMFSYRDNPMEMMPDFERPPFYVELFKSWGLE